MILRLFLLLALLATPAAAQDFPAMHRVVGVVAGDVLNVRAEPNARAPIVGRFARTETGIEIVGLSADGNWGLVRSGEGIGWASMRYLQRERSDSWRDGQQGLVCLGTEPFWNLTFFLPDNRAEFVSPDDSFEMRTDAPNLPGTRFPPTLALPFQGAREGFAVVRGGECSDGMSDQLFGLEVQVYWRGQSTGLNGCCTLAR